LLLLLWLGFPNTTQTYSKKCNESFIIANFTVVRVQDIIDEISCNPTLKGKNVVIILQMCRGPKQLIALSDPLNIPRGFFIMFTSQPGFKSYTTKEGSLFIEVLTGLIKKRATVWPLQKILAQTTRTVSGTNQGDVNVKQIPQLHANCSKTVWLANEG
jgi:hypothetical protein